MEMDTHASGLLIFWRENKMSAFNNATLMITGGTGSFGNAVLNRFLQTDIGGVGSSPG